MEALNAVQYLQRTTPITHSLCAHRDDGQTNWCMYVAFSKNHFCVISLHAPTTKTVWNILQSRMFNPLVMFDHVTACV